MYLNYVKFNLNLLKIMWKEKLTISVKQILLERFTSLKNF